MKGVLIYLAGLLTGQVIGVMALALVSVNKGDR